MHTDSTLKILNDATILLGQRLRHFAAETCKHFHTFETDNEYRARIRATQRRQERVGALNGGGATSEQLGGAQHSSGGKRPKFFSLATSKLHALGDYVLQIHRFGTTDSFSTQTVSETLMAMLTFLTWCFGYRASCSTL
jgi:hypothetical protein